MLFGKIESKSVFDLEMYVGLSPSSDLDGCDRTYVGEFGQISIVEMNFFLLIDRLLSYFSFTRMVKFIIFTS